MKVAVIAPAGGNRETLAVMLRDRLPRHQLVCCGLAGLRQEGLPRDTAAAFALVDDMHDLLALRAVAGLYPALPMAVISHSPDFALDAIRQGARDYLVRPVMREELDRAIRRVGLCGEGGAQLEHTNTG